MPLAGSFTFVLHSHLPYVVSHGRWPHGTDWLSEATAETYIPILDALERLAAEGISPRLTLGLTPILCEQLADPGFHDEFRSYLRTKIEAAQEDMDAFTRVGDIGMANVARMWFEFYLHAAERFEAVDGNLVQAFRRLQDAGLIEIITSAATHGYLPLLSHDTSVQAQVKVGVETYKKHFGRQPRGIWLPECAYRPRYEWDAPVQPETYAFKPYLRKGVDELLSENGIEYFLVDSHLLKGGKAVGVYRDRFPALQQLWQQFEKGYQSPDEDAEKSPYQVYLVNSSGEPKRPVAIFTRDPRTGLQVWSGEHGYPGNGAYLDFHKKRFPGGLRYWAVTDIKADLADKQPYDPDRARAFPAEQAAHFAGVVKGLLREHQHATGKPGIVVAPYDAELFGHWWFEGPQWLYEALKALASDPEIQMTTCGAHLDADPPSLVVSIPEGSWGEGGFHWVWLNEWTTWIWRHIYDAERTMQELAPLQGGPDLNRVLQQLARELLLLQSSDWPFLVTTWSARDYAEMRAAGHSETFQRLAVLARNLAGGGSMTSEDEEYLREAETRDNPFRDLDLTWFCRLEYPPRAGVPE